MRVISGLYRSRLLDGYCLDGTRPTMDRIKESMFASINSYIKDSVCLDLFSGSGSLGIEALSNGAKYCLFNDCTKAAIEVLNNNLTNLKVDNSNYSVLKLDYMSALKYIKDSSYKLDVVFLDPPYGMNVINNILDYIYDNDLLSEDGIIVYEHSKYELNNNKFVVYKEKKFKDIVVSVYKKNS